MTKKAAVIWDKDQELTCTHYKNKPLVWVVEHKTDADEVWVRDTSGKIWWGPKSWFKAVKSNG